MAKTVVVLFNPDKAVLLVNPGEDQYLKHPNYLVNPDLSGVAGVPPHLWVRKGSKVVAMTGEAAGAHTTAIMRTNNPLQTGTTIYRNTPILHHIVVIIVSVALSYGVRLLLK